MGIKITGDDGNVVNLKVGANGLLASEVSAAIAQQERLSEAASIPLAKVVPIAPPKAEFREAPRTSNKSESPSPASPPPPPLSSLDIDFSQIENKWAKAINTGDPTADADILKKIMEMIKAFFNKLFALGRSSVATSSGSVSAAPNATDSREPRMTGSTAQMASLAKRINQLAAAVTPPADLKQVAGKDTLKTLCKLKMNAATADVASASELIADLVQSMRARWAENAGHHGFGAVLSKEHLLTIPSMSASELARIDPSGELHALSTHLPKATDLLRSKVENLVLLMQVFAGNPTISYTDLDSALKAKNLTFASLMTDAQSTHSKVAVDGLILIAKEFEEREPTVFGNSDLSAMVKGMVPPAAEKPKDKANNTASETPTPDVSKATASPQKEAPEATFSDQDKVESAEAEGHAMR